MDLGDVVALLREGAVRDVSHDSRRVQPGSVFVAIPGTRTDGHGYIGEAVARGAALVVAERLVAPAPPVPVVLVPDSREALAVLAAAKEGEPARQLTLVGITGTNGKTTVAHMLTHVLSRAGRPVGRLGTISNEIGGRLEPAQLTTPDPLALHAYFRRLKEAGAEVVVMEVSSHALVQKRVFGCVFQGAVFTNLSRDHLDFHGTMEAYREAKAMLFAAVAPEGWAVVNADDAAAERMARAVRGRVRTVSLLRPADLTAADIRPEDWGMRFSVSMAGRRYEGFVPLPGRVHVQSALLAVAAAREMGIPPDQALAALPSLPVIPGRMERVHRDPRGYDVVVDFAHNPGALAALLESLRPVVRGRILLVFGAEGGKDRGKRRPMGEVAGRGADEVILTHDNPHAEPPEQILGEVEEGLRAVTSRYRVIPDRREAIAAALALAGPGDVVVVAGKGHETTQVFADGPVPFSDAQVIRELLGRPSAAPEVPASLP